MTRSIACSLLVAVALCVGAMGTVRADTATSHYNVAIWNSITNDYPVTGTMDISFAPNGVVRGYYHPAGLPSFIPITGGRTGDHVWLTIGINGGWQLDGHFRDGKIVGSAVNERPASAQHPIPGAYSFTATPG